MPPRPRVLPPPPRVIPPSAATRSVSAAPSNYPGSGTQAGPRQETARITILPEAAAPVATPVKMAKTQPLLTIPSPQLHHAPAIVPAENGQTWPRDPVSMLDAVPLPVCWTIFAISAVTLLIQIWNYFGS
ncbi:MAG TPA: hypothetical protein VK474_09955 [Chthoniobacterales bacterium]|nr:hypothetical protein [Chthoniobacterales bacterium]